MHKHKCPKCGAVWEHEDAEMLPELMDRTRRKKHDASHVCPRLGCGATEKFIYHGPDPVTNLGAAARREKEIA